MAPEELEALIQERMGLIEKEEQAKREAMNPKTESMNPKMESMMPQQIQEERFEQNKMEVEFSHQQQQLQMQQQVEQEIHLEENGKKLKVSNKRIGSKKRNT